MKIAKAKLRSASAYSQSRNYEQDAPKEPKELPAAYEERTWRHRCHTTSDGRIYIPGTAFANCLKEMCKRLRIKIPGKGNSEYTKYFEAGVMVTEGIVLDAKASEVPCDKLFVPSDGKRGGPKRVWKYFPRIDSWFGEVTFYVLDDIITPEVFREVLEASGQLVGIGRFRPQSSGFYGRFIVEEITWLEGDAAMRAMTAA